MISRRLIALFFLSYICQFVLAQDVELRTQLDVDLFDPATTIIQGDLEIGSAISDITNLSTLSNLQTVTGDLIIKDNPLLQSLSGLENLNSVINDFEIEDNLILENLEALSSLTNIGFDLVIENNSKLTDLSGLDNLLSIRFGLYIEDNSALTNVDALADLDSILILQIINNPVLENLDGLANIQSFNSRVTIESNPSLQNLDLFSNVDSIHGLLHIEQNDLITDLDGLSNLEYVGGLNLIDCRLSSLAGLSNLRVIDGTLLVLNDSTLTTVVLPSLERINGLINFRNTNELDEIDFPQLQFAGSIAFVENQNLSHLYLVMDTMMMTEDITIEDNPILETVNLPNAVITNRDIDIVRNPLLESVALPKLKVLYDDILIENNPLLSILDFSGVETVGGFFDLNIDLVTELDFSNLNSVVGSFLLNCANLETIHLDLLERIGNNLQVVSCNMLAEFDAPLLNRVGGIINFMFVDSLTTINLPLLEIANDGLRFQALELITLNLPLLHSVNGDLSFTTTKIPVIDLPQLSGAVQDIIFSSNEAVEIRMPLVTSCQQLWFKQNHSLINMDGFPNLEMTGNTVTIINNDALLSVDGLQNLNYIKGNCYIYGNDALLSIILPSLVTLDGEASLSGLLVETVRFDELRTVGDELSVWGTPVLNFPVLMSVGHLDLVSIKDESIEFPALTTIVGDANFIEIDTIEELIFTALDSVGGTIYFVDCENLRKMDFSSLLNLGGLDVTQMEQLEEVYFSSVTEMDGTLFAYSNPLLKILDFASLTSIGDLHLEETGELENLDGFTMLTEVDGFLNLLSNPVLSNIDGLSNLEFIESDTDISNNSDLESLSGLESLDRVGGNFNLMDNQALESLIGLQNLKIIEGDFNIENIISVYNLAGLENINTIEGELIIRSIGLETIEELNSLENLGGLLITGCLDLILVNSFSMIDSITNSCHLESNELLSNISGFDNLTYVGDRFRLRQLDSLKSLNTFQNLNYVGGDFLITSCDSLKGFPGLSSLNAVGGDFEISNNGLLELDALSNLLTVDGDFTIRSNRSLSDCCGIQQLLTTPDAISGDISISSNILECFNEDAVINSTCADNYFAFGRILVDSDQTGCDGTQVFPFGKFDVETDFLDYELILNEQGEYQIALPVEGDYVITPMISEYYSISPESLIINNPNDLQQLENDFCLTVNGVFKDLKIDVLPLNEARPGFEAEYKIIYQNIGTVVQSGNIGFSYNSNYMTYLMAFPEAAEVMPGRIEWDYIDLKPFDKHEIILSFELNTPQASFPLSGGETLVYEAEIFPVADDETRSNNNSKIEQVVVNSFDPNDKTCLQGDYLLDTILGGFINYLIRFENTGTADAVNIEVTDKIDTSVFEIRTINVIDASHSVYTLIEADLVHFVFDDIYLPIEDEENDGYVLFEIKTKSQIALGDTIANQADIFFDFNDPIMTNIASATVVTDNDGDGFHNEIDCNDENSTVYPGAPEIAGNDIDEDCDGSDLSSVLDLIDKQIIVYPNPASSEINIEAQDLDISLTSLYDVHGKLIKQCLGCSKLDVAGLESGTYILKLKDQLDGQQYLIPVLIFE